MALIALVALTLISPTIMKAIIPRNNQATWDRRQYIVHLVSLVLLWWTAILAALVLNNSRSDLQRACRRPGPAAIFAAGTAFLYLAVQQLAVSLVWVFGWPQRLVPYYWVFNILEHAGDAAGVSVAAVWVILALIKTERHSTNWLESLGRAVGWIWISWGLLNHLVWFAPIPWLTGKGIG